MEFSWPCPVCGNTKITPVLRKTLMPSSPLDDITVLAYRCEAGHICLADGTREADEITEPAA